MPSARQAARTMPSSLAMAKVRRRNRYSKSSCVTATHPFSSTWPSRRRMRPALRQWGCARCRYIPRTTAERDLRASAHGQKDARLAFPRQRPQVRNLSRLSSFPQVSRLSWPLIAAWGWTRWLARHSFSGTRRPRGWVPLLCNLCLHRVDQAGEHGGRWRLPPTLRGPPLPPQDFVTCRIQSS